jgi:hypothetical protein
MFITIDVFEVKRDLKNYNRKTCYIDTDSIEYIIHNAHTVVISAPEQDWIEYVTDANGHTSPIHSKRKLEQDIHIQLIEISMKSGHKLLAVPDETLFSILMEESEDELEEELEEV